MFIKEFNIKTNKKFIDLTQNIKNWLIVNNHNNGLLNIFSKHSTCGISIMENEILSKLDICKHIEKLAPAHGKYDHDRIDLRQVPPDERVNGHSHIWKLYFPSSETIPVSKGSMLLGEWQSILLIELDWQEPFRDRTVVFTFIDGEQNEK